ncbi:MAG: zinc ribbon domain-containing protein [Chromatocurvus sp.]
MPLYDYRCERCTSTFETLHALTAPAPACPECGGSSAKVFFSTPAVHGTMTQGREQAVQSLQPRTSTGHRHGPGCGCAHRH